MSEKHLWTTVYFLILFRVFLGGEHSKWTIVSTTSRCKFHTISRWYNCRGVWWSSIVNGKRCRLSAWWTVVPLAFTYFVINRGRSSCIVCLPIYYFIGRRCWLKYILYLPDTSSLYTECTWICCVPPIIIRIGTIGIICASCLFYNGFINPGTACNCKVLS